MLVHPDCEDYSITRAGGYSWEDDLYLTGACLPTGGRIAAYCVLLFMFGSAMSLGWISFYGFWSKNKDFTFLKKISSQTLLLFTMSATSYFITYLFYLFRPHPAVAPLLMSISSTAGQFSLYYSSESWFQSLEGTKGSAGSNLQEMTGKLLQELRFRSRIIIAIAGVISIIGHSLTAAGLGIFNAIPPAVLRDAAAAHNGSLGSVPAVVTAYGLTTAGMTIVHTWTAVTVIVLSYFMYKYGSMLAEMIMDTVNKMGGGTGKKGAAYEKMEARAQEVKQFALKQTPITALQVSSLNIALALWGLASLGSPQGAGYSFWLISFKSVANALGMLQGTHMFGWSILKKDRERKDDPRRPSEAGSTVSRTERSKSIAESKRDSMVEPNSKRASIVEQGVVKSSSVAGEEIGVAGQSPTTARTLVPVAEETKPEKKSETEAIKEETTAEASSTSAATPPPVVPEPSPASLAIQQPDVVVTYPSTGDVANKNPEANQ